MRKKTAPAPRNPRTQPALGDQGRQRRADLACRAYILKALRRFELEGRFESSRQPRARMRVRGILEQE